MRKVQQQEILELVKTLHEAHVEIKENIEKRQNHIAQSILADCQECAISIGNVIEAFEGEGFVTISFLEEYCQVLFQSHESLNDTNVNENRIYKNLEKQLIRIENSIKTDIPIRKEIAFFPYKASMWDSLESIYLAAKEDPNVDAYCVPIPYFDLNPDRSFGQMHYEGLEYPKNIEVIDWQTYNFEERKPDMIYIHNPYDNWNLVTSVHPRFYSDRLKAATEELVYVPYFVLGEIEPADQQAIDGMKHFCFLPGIINADKVILQSEKMAKIYVNEYLKAANANGFAGKHINRDALNKKFLGLGSPKLEKVKNIKREDLEIPEEWRKIIEKPDGSWKKIIFYNTGIAALLEHNEKMLEKMRWVFNIFKEKQDEVALLWRPHPLIKNTVSAMRPWLWEEYDKLVQQYRKEGWGIYDDTADMDRAVVLSDAYYGDASSVVQVYRQTGKPLLYEMPYICERNEVYQDLEFENFYEDEEYLWFTAFHFNGLFKMNKSDWEVQFVGVFPNEDLAGFRLYSKIIEYEDKLYFTPLRANEIAVYEKKNNVFSKISYDELEIGYLADYSGWNFYDAQLYEDSIYFFPHQRMAVLQYDLKDKELKVISAWVTNLTDTNKFLQPRVFYRTEMKDGIVYAPVSGCNLLECIDLNTKQVEIYEIGKKGSTYSDICIIGNKGYICPFDGEEIIEWDILDKKERKALRFLENSNGSIQFQGLCKLGKKVYAFPEYFDHVLEIDSDTGEIEIKNVFEEDYVQSKKYINALNPIECRYTLCCESKEKIYVYCYATRRLTEYGMEGGHSKKIVIDGTDEHNKNYTGKRRAYVEDMFRDKTKIQIEKSSYSLYDFLKCILEE